jgi:probable phosphoglycerate mutase
MLRRPVEFEDDIAEAAFGAWDGLTYSDARALDEVAFEKWLGSMDLPAGGNGESIKDVEQRVRRARDRIITAHPGKTALVVSHVTPIKLLVRSALDMPLDALFRTELSPAGVTVVSWYPDGHPVLRLFNGRPTGLALEG